MSAAKSVSKAAIPERLRNDEPVRPLRIFDQRKRRGFINPSPLRSISNHLLMLNVPSVNVRFEDLLVVVLIHDSKPKPVVCTSRAARLLETALFE